MVSIAKSSSLSDSAVRWQFDEYHQRTHKNEGINCVLTMDSRELRRLLKRSLHARESPR